MESLTANGDSYMKYVNILMNMGVSLFDWQNLPETIDPRYLEVTEFLNGSSVFFADEVMGFLSLNCIPRSRFNVYGEPIERRAYSRYNNYNKELTDKDSVIIWNNNLRVNTYPVIENFAMQLWELDRVINVNVKAQKTPILLQGTEKQQLTLKNLYMQYDGNVPFIFGDSNLDLNSIKVISTGAPYVADRLYQLKTQIWNEALTYLGVSNTSYQKRERLISDEVTRSQGGTIANRWSKLEARQIACEKINRMFGLDIWCEFNKDYNELVDKMTVDVTKEVVDNETLE